MLERRLLIKMKGGKTRAQKTIFNKVLKKLNFHNVKYFKIHLFAKVSFFRKDFSDDKSLSILVTISNIRKLLKKKKLLI